MVYFTQNTSRVTVVTVIAADAVVIHSNLLIGASSLVGILSIVAVFTATVKTVAALSAPVKGARARPE